VLLEAARLEVDACEYLLRDARWPQEKMISIIRLLLAFAGAFNDVHRQLAERQNEYVGGLA
jgi:hypothetical protein